MTQADSPFKHEIRFALQKAEGLSSEGKHLHAIQIYLRLLRDFPAEESSALGLASLYNRAGNVESAIALLREALEKNPDNTRLRLYTGHFFFKQQMWQDVIDVLTFIPPGEEPLTAFFSGYAYYQLKEYTLSRHYFQLYLAQPIQLDFAQDAYVFLTKIAIHLSEFDAAMRNLNSAELFYSAHYELHLLKAIIYYYQEMYTHALISIDESLALHKNDRIVLEWAGRIYLQCGKPKKAEVFLRHCVDESEAPDASVLAHLGLACLYNMKVKEADVYFSTALKMEPEEPNALLGKQKMRTEHKYFSRR